MLYRVYIEDMDCVSYEVLADDYNMDEYVQDEYGGYYLESEAHATITHNLIYSNDIPKILSTDNTRGLLSYDCAKYLKGVLLDNYIKLI